MQPNEIKTIIEANLPEAQAILTGDGRHFEAIVISPIFAGRSRVEKQQLVYASLGDRVANGSIHAISIKTFTPDEWNQQSKEP